jgi:hypothetical protein
VLLGGERGLDSTCSRAQLGEGQGSTGSHGASPCAASRRHQEEADRAIGLHRVWGWSHRPPYAASMGRTPAAALGARERSRRRPGGVEGAQERREASSGEDSTAADRKGERSGWRKRGGRQTASAPTSL